MLYDDFTKKLNLIDEFVKEIIVDGTTKNDRRLLPGLERLEIVEVNFLRNLNLIAEQIKIMREEKRSALEQ